MGPDALKSQKTDREGISYHDHPKMLVVLDGDPLKKVVKKFGGYHYFHHTSNTRVRLCTRVWIHTAVCIHIEYSVHL